MSGRECTKTICTSLYELREELEPEQKSDVTDLMRYSYLLSLQGMIENMETLQYGSCEES